MSDYNTVNYATDGAVAIVTIARPDAMNSFNTELRKELAAALTRALDQLPVDPQHAHRVLHLLGGEPGARPIASRRRR